MQSLGMSLAAVQIILFALMNIVGTWYFVRVTSVDPLSPQPEPLSGIERSFERVWLVLDWLSLLYLPALLCGVAATAGDNVYALGLRNFLYAWLMGRIVVPIIAPEEDIPVDIGFIGYIRRRYKDFWQTLLMLPIKKVLIFGLFGWVISILFSAIGLLDRLQTSYNDALPFAGFPVFVESMSPRPPLTPMSAGALMAFGLFLSMRISAFMTLVHRFPMWVLFVTMTAGVCLLGRTQLFSGIDYTAWPTWPTTAELVAACISVVLGTIPPLTIAFLRRKSRAFARA
ncbi:hypothetical protein [Mesorhizobium sp. SP-1A]|uniref:hypothetical protein n=1 Tax=Mesorhizobium sp. SP-1A TaxID=3077840 RepID=UPI0028F6D0FE|nr:hypothetical protein [Mesorhizobium sp. SP-1A]